MTDASLEAETALVARHLCAIDPGLVKRTKRAINYTLERQGLLDALEAALAALSLVLVTNAKKDGRFGPGTERKKHTQL